MNDFVWDMTFRFRDVELDDWDKLVTLIAIADEILILKNTLCGRHNVSLSRRNIAFPLYKVLDLAVRNFKVVCTHFDIFILKQRWTLLTLRAVHRWLIVFIIYILFIMITLMIIILSILLVMNLHLTFTYKIILMTTL